MLGMRVDAIKHLTISLIFLSVVGVASADRYFLECGKIMIV